MKVVILAGGKGSRLSEYTDRLPKPMVEIGGKPMLWHIMKLYAKHGFTDFIIAGGYLVNVIDNWLDASDLPWNVTLIDTGIDTTTGGRLLKLNKFLSDQFMLTYGDGVADININDLLTFHNSHQSVCTVSAVHPPARFGHLVLDNSYVAKFDEKPVRDWINGGFFVCEPEALSYIHGDEAWESGALTRMSNLYLLSAYRHEGLWQCMDTVRDIQVLEDIYKEKGYLL